MYPILIDLGFFQLPAYGVLLVAAFLAASYFLQRLGTGMHLPAKQLTDVAVLTLLFALMGAKLLLIAVDLPYYLEKPARLLGTIRSAGVLYGGLIAGSLAAWWSIRRYRLPLWDTLDLMAAVTPLGIAIGRLGCLSVGCCYGMPFDGPLALHFPNHPACEAPAGIGLFPIQLLAALNGLLLFAVTLQLLRKRRYPGQVLAWFLMLYSAIRLVEEHFRGDELRGIWQAGLATSQWIALAILPLGATLLIAARRKAA